MHIHSPHPLHTYVNSTSRDYTTVCQQLRFLPKPLPLREGIQWQNSNVPADVTIQRQEKYEKP